MLERTRDPDKRAEHEAELYCPPLPEALAYLWNIFVRLSARRSTGLALQPLSFLEIDAFCRLSGFRLVPWELRLIEHLDDIFRGVHAGSKDQ